jgi:signal transduction histidine kinase
VTPTTELSRSLSSAREEERRRWARELHDDTLQSLAALRIGLACARRASDVESLRQAIEGAVSGLDREIGNLRALITDLRPPALDALGLRDAVGTLAGRAGTTHGISVTTTVSLDGRLHPELETAVYRLVQEALTNAVRHGEARRVAISIGEAGEELAVSVRDDGCGFDPAVPTAGFGLAGMRERVELAGGRLQIGSSSRGTQVSARLPRR